MAKKKTTQRSTKGQKKRPVTAEESEQMFRLWCRIKTTQGFMGVAKAFKRSVTTVRRVARAEKWEVRYGRVQAEVQRKSEKTVARQEISNLQLATHVMRATFSQLFIKGADGKERLAQVPSVRDFIAAAQHAQQQQDRFPDDGNDQVTQLTKDKIEEALGVFDRFASKKMWEALGHFIVENDIRPDDPPSKKISNTAPENTTQKEQASGSKKRAAATAA